MNNVKILYFNSETIQSDDVTKVLSVSQNYKSHYVIKPGLLLVNYNGTAEEVFRTLGNLVMDKSVLIHDLDSDSNSFWGYMNRNVWEWLRNNRS